jgi:hypothetical protein
MVTAQHKYPFVYQNIIPAISLEGDTLLQPWAGGVNNVQINELDVNFDCLPDLVLFEVLPQRIKVYINEGDSITPNYVYHPGYSKFFPKEIKGFMKLIDYNDDDLLDIFCYADGVANGLSVYRNVSDTVLAFELEVAQVKGDYTGFPWPVFGGAGTVPAIGDANNDGLIDINSFDQGATTVDFFRADSVVDDSTYFTLQTKCWGGFYESYDSVKLFAPCKGKRNASRGSAGGITLFDLENNSLMDVLLSHSGSGSITVIHNGGTYNDALMTSVTKNFPDNTVPVDVPEMPIPYFVNLDHSTPSEMLVSPYLPGVDTNNLWLYEKELVNGVWEFSYVRNDFLVAEELDFGTRAFPYLIDINGDGLRDMLIANHGYFDSTSAFGQTSAIPYYTSRFAYVENVGQPGQPAFQVRNTNYLNMFDLGKAHVLPAIGDLTGDGAMDLITVDEDGQVRFYSNMAGPTDSVEWEFDSILSVTGIQAESSPMLFDVNGDNLLDLVVSAHQSIDAFLDVYLNHGTATNPVFNTLDIHKLGQLSLDFNYSAYSRQFHFTHFNEDGNEVLVVADRLGNVVFFDSLQHALNTPLMASDTLEMGRLAMGVAVGKIDSLSAYNMFLGHHSGGVSSYFMNDSLFNAPATFGILCDTVTQSGGTGINELANRAFKVYPNPTSGQFTVKLTTSAQGPVSIRIVDLGGKNLLRVIII